MSHRIFRVDHPSGAYQWRIQFADLAADPTATAPKFQIIETGEGDDDATLSTWTNGTWPVAYNATRKTAWAATPLIGAGGLTVAAGSRYRLLCQLTLGSGHDPLYELGLIEVAGSTDRALGR